MREWLEAIVEDDELQHICTEQSRHEAVLIVHGPDEVEIVGRLIDEVERLDASNTALKTLSDTLAQSVDPDMRGPMQVIMDQARQLDDLCGECEGLRDEVAQLKAREAKETETVYVGSDINYVVAVPASERCALDDTPEAYCVRACDPSVACMIWGLYRGKWHPNAAPRWLVRHLLHRLHTAVSEARESESAGDDEDAQP